MYVTSLKEDVVEVRRNLRLSLLDGEASLALVLGTGGAECMFVT